MLFQPGRIFSFDRPPDHQRDQISFRQLVVDVVGALPHAVAQNGHPVGERQDFRQAVTDIDDRGAGGDNPADDIGQRFDAGDVEARGRLVEQQDLRVCRERLDDFEELPLRRTQLSDQRIGRDAEAVRRQLLCRPLPLAARLFGPSTAPRSKFSVTESSRTSESS